MKYAGLYFLLMMNFLLFSSNPGEIKWIASLRCHQPTQTCGGKYIRRQAPPRRLPPLRPKPVPFALRVTALAAGSVRDELVGTSVVEEDSYKSKRPAPLSLTRAGVDSAFSLPFRSMSVVRVEESAAIRHRNFFQDCSVLEELDWHSADTITDVRDLISLFNRLGVYFNMHYTDLGKGGLQAYWHLSRARRRINAVRAQVNGGAARERIEQRCIPIKTIPRPRAPRVRQQR